MRAWSGSSLDFRRGVPYASLRSCGEAMKMLRLICVYGGRFTVGKYATRAGDVHQCVHLAAGASDRLGRHASAAIRTPVLRLAYDEDARVNRCKSACAFQGNERGTVAVIRAVWARRGDGRLLWSGASARLACTPLTQLYNWILAHCTRWISSILIMIPSFFLFGELIRWCCIAALHRAFVVVARAGS
jgi:hypothetical protein